uniref:Uncharacterized protein n=1 Tax=Cucumis melo TaxID=3656 RepID=A0A9I9E6R7_CUCME
MRLLYARKVSGWRDCKITWVLRAKLHREKDYDELLCDLNFLNRQADKDVTLTYGILVLGNSHLWTERVEDDCLLKILDSHVESRKKLKHIKLKEVENSGDLKVMFGRELKKGKKSKEISGVETRLRKQGEQPGRQNCSSCVSLCIAIEFKDACRAGLYKVAKDNQRLTFRLKRLLCYTQIASS